VILIPIVCLVALAACLWAARTRAGAYFRGATSVRSVVALDVLSLALGLGAAVATVAASASDEEHGIAIVTVLVGALPLLPLLLPGRAGAVSRLAVALALNGWVVLTGLSVGLLYAPAALAATAACLVGVWTGDAAAPRP
jgi:hypothetical protein